MYICSRARALHRHAGSTRAVRESSDLVVQALALPHLRERGSVLVRVRPLRVCALCARAGGCVCVCTRVRLCGYV